MTKVYYAHFMGIYNTPQEQRDIATLEALGYEVVNPNQPGIQDAVDKAKQKYINLPNGSDLAFKEVFDALVDSCEVLAFRALPDGRIPAGVSKEVLYARQNGKIAIELPGSFIKRSMSIAETREYLHDMGQR